ncbi:hypothetical protein Mal4_53900 [Maioricimonas rarisocia]|uniref:DUF5658 domain-containing protein n=1 Tax=Maioricimonas rarisocia TaxID=2528026 RepID=A0A517ZEV6_9PLAN|nr:DUF5658 family protein [Maioricimonas rarisocia]QDU41025.1 hypothetical protein Mal4_53900 [Maioricimonas rarisocia]
MKAPGIRLAYCGWLGAVTIALLWSSSSALAQPPERAGRWARGEGERWQRFSRWGGDRRGAARPLKRTVEFGHLFVSGEYVPPPYEVSYEDQQLQINGVVVPIDAASHVGFDDGDGDGDAWDDGNQGNSRRRQSQYPRALRTVLQSLEADDVVVVFPGAPPEILGADPLFELLAADDRVKALDAVMQVLSPAADREEWTEWLLNYEPPSDLLEYATTWVAHREDVHSDNLASINAVRRLDQFAYPLSVFGMIIGAMSVGHLLSYRPTIAENWQETDASPLAIRMLSRSVILIVVLSLFDLVWTILASQAGQMKELNPLASYFVHDPVGLIIFKSVATCVGVGLLVALRHYRRAQTATWWVCLVCTLLVFRWLTFSSMYVA